MQASNTMEKEDLTPKQRWDKKNPNRPDNKRMYATEGGRLYQALKKRIQYYIKNPDKKTGTSLSEKRMVKLEADLKKLEELTGETFSIKGYAREYKKTIES